MKKKTSNQIANDIVRNFDTTKPEKPAEKPVVKPVSAEKQPWEMTLEEYVKPPYTSPAMHIYGVEMALSKGKFVPESVLKDYPDLMAKYGKKSAIDSTKQRAQPWKITREKFYSFENVAKCPLKFSQGILGGVVDTAARMVSKDGKTRCIHAPTGKVLMIVKDLTNLAPGETRYWVVFKSDENRITVLEFTKSEIAGE